MSPQIQVAILEDHQSTIDGYVLRLQNFPQIKIVGVAYFGVDLETLLKNQPATVLLLDVTVKTAPDNPAPYPVLHVIPKLLQTYPSLTILVISMHTERTLIQNVMDVGASGYIFKDDVESIKKLGTIIANIADGEIYLSQQAHHQLLKRQSKNTAEPKLSPRQLEALSLCAAYPGYSYKELAGHMNIANSTVRNLLSNAFIKLGVHNRTMAVFRARELGLITPLTQTLNV